ncbi:MAG: S4 domain-containing protein [Candidatus Cloacimonadia bacterium]
MRIDQLLNKLCLVKSRSIAKNACDQGLVKINDKVAKGSAEVKENDLIEYSIYGYQTKIRITSIPQGNVAKRNAAEYYELISRDKLTPTL